MKDHIALTLPHEDLMRRRFHVVSGKGGVGKSMVSMILGMAFASQGLKTLICEVDQYEHLSEMFHQAPSQGECIALSPELPTLYGVNIQFQNALHEYAHMKLKFKTLHHLLLENPLMKALINLIPGVQDLVALGKAFHHERETDTEGPLWDRIIVDAPATGHGFTFLSLPKIIQDSVRGGNLRQEADAMWALLNDRTRCAIHLVSLPEEMSVQETIELEHALQTELQLDVDSLWINRFPIQYFSTHTQEEWSTFCQHAPSHIWHPYTSLIQQKIEQYQWAQHRVQPLYDMSQPIAMLSQLPKNVLHDVTLMLQHIRSE